MSNVVDIGRSCAYLVFRAARHCRAGRFDEAMTLLVKAKDQYGLNEEIELEMAHVYEAMGCDEEACRAYLRIVRLEGKYKALALFELALSALQRADVRRAAAYHQMFVLVKSKHGVSEEMASLLAQQIRREMIQPLPADKKGRASCLERHAVAALQQGKMVSAGRKLRHAIHLHPSAQRYSLLACTCLLRGQLQDALDYAKVAHGLKPAHIQTLCVLADAQQSMQNDREAKRIRYLATMRARTTEDIHLMAMEAMKHGDDMLTLLLTRRLLKREPFHTQGMSLRACALLNNGKTEEATRLFARLCGLLPENTVCEAYHRAAREGKFPAERLGLAFDVIRQEGIERVAELIALLGQDLQKTENDPVLLRRVCRNAAWAFRSSMTGKNTRTAALILLSALSSAQAQNVLLDALCDPQVEDSFKLMILQVLSDKDGFKPYYVDYEGRLVRLAAGGVTSTQRKCENSSKVLQRACDQLGARFSDAPKVLLPVYIRYIEMYAEPKRKHEAACAAALEYMYFYLKKIKQDIPEHVYTGRGITRRLRSVFIRRLMKAEQSCAEEQT